MSQFKKFRRQIIENFNAGQPITIIGFYNLIDTPLLEKIRRGLERDFDAASAGQSPRSAEWITTRLGIINHILEGRKEQSVTRQKEGGQAGFNPFRVNRSSLVTAGLLIVQTPFGNSRLTYLASMLMLVFTLAYMSRLLGPVQPKQPKRKKPDVANPADERSNTINHTRTADRIHP